MVGIMKESLNPAGPAGRPGKDVTNQDALVFGFIAAMVVFVSTLVFTKAWTSLTALGLVVLYTLITFAVVSLSALGMQWLTRNDKQHENRDFPVLD